MKKISEVIQIILVRYKLFALTILCLLIASIITLMFVPEGAMTKSLLDPTPNPAIANIIGALGVFFFGAGMTEDYYRCKYNDRPTVLFCTPEENEERIQRDIKKVPALKHWYKLTGRMKE
jgi:hypothetical protein